jgi:hypothetical protein
VKCTSQNRCSSISCERCARRYGRRVARRILVTRPRHLFEIKIDASLLSVMDFWQWRVDVRNWIDHRRRSSRHWRSAGLYLWLSHDSRVRGVITLDAITRAEVEIALGKRWPITLHSIDPTDLHQRIYAAVRPNVISLREPDQGRYQPRKLAIWPHRIPVLIEPRLSPRENNFTEPMPILI